MIYLAYTFIITPKDPGTEILIAELGQAGFESFVENDLGVIAYIQKKDVKENMLSDIYILNQKECAIQYTYEEIAQENWNKAWEDNFQPIQVDNKVSIRAPFHTNPGLDYDIIIEPKMSFGTGHHETTHMMVQHLINEDLKDKSVLDMGCGTGVLAIFSAMRGATYVEAIDIDSWSYENSVENCERNGFPQIKVMEGDASLLVDKSFDLIIANINRNILLADLKTYASCLKNEGILLLSGFYQDDVIKIDTLASKLGLALTKTLERNQWISLRYMLKKS